MHVKEQYFGYTHLKNGIRILLLSEVFTFQVTTDRGRREF